MRTATWIKADGTETTVKSSGPAFSLGELQKMVGGYIELTRTKPPVRRMWVNEEGLNLGLPINAKATELISPDYWTAGGIRGDVVVIETNSSRKENH